jgi:hypothetical protein
MKSFTGAIDSGRDQDVVCSQATGLDAGTVKRSGERWDYKKRMRDEIRQVDRSCYQSSETRKLRRNTTQQKSGM